MGYFGEYSPIDGDTVRQNIKLEIITSQFKNSGPSKKRVSSKVVLKLLTKLNTHTPNKPEYD